MFARGCEGRERCRNTDADGGIGREHLERAQAGARGLGEVSVEIGLCRIGDDEVEIVVEDRVPIGTKPNPTGC